jgi:hypothetical protein
MGCTTSSDSEAAATVIAPISPLRRRTLNGNLFASPRRHSTADRQLPKTADAEGEPESLNEGDEHSVGVNSSMSGAGSSASSARRQSLQRLAKKSRRGRDGSDGRRSDGNASPKAVVEPADGAPQPAPQPEMLRHQSAGILRGSEPDEEVLHSRLAKLNAVAKQKHGVDGSVGPPGERLTAERCMTAKSYYIVRLWVDEHSVAPILEGAEFSPPCIAVPGGTSARSEDYAADDALDDAYSLAHSRDQPDRLASGGDEPNLSAAVMALFQKQLFYL